MINYAILTIIFYKGITGGLFPLSVLAYFGKYITISLDYIY